MASHGWSTHRTYQVDGVERLNTAAASKLVGILPERFRRRQKLGWRELAGGTFPTLPKVYPGAIANKTEDTFSRSELEEAIRKKQLTRISAKESAEIIGVSPSLVIRWASEGCPYLEGKTIKRFSPTTNLRNGAKSRNGVTYDREEIGEIANRVHSH